MVMATRSSSSGGGLPFRRLGSLIPRWASSDPTGPRNALLYTTLALLAFGMLIQLSHASTTLPAAEFSSAMGEQLLFRLTGAGMLLVGMFVGPRGIERLIPAATVLCTLGLVLVFVPGFEQPINGAHRWIRLFGRGPSIQPSEVARVVFVLWVARRCALLDGDVRSLRYGFIPTLLMGLLAGGLIFREPDLGGALLFLLCFGLTLFVGGARKQHVALVAAVGVLLLLVALSTFSHVSERFAVWTGGSSNSQVTRASEAMASGGLTGVGFGQGGFRNAGLQYTQTDYALSLVGQEFGLPGLLLVIGLFSAFVWFSLRLVLSVRDRFAALAAFGLTLSVALQAMVHLQVVTQLAPPKGMALPFLSDGGSSLLASCLAAGLALGAARPRDHRSVPRTAP